MNPPPPNTQRSGLALASTILGVCGVVLCLGPILGLPAVICGHIAQSRIRRSAGLLTGQGLAITGLVTGYLSIVMVFIIVPLVTPNFVKARRGAQFQACQNNLKIIQAAKDIWSLENKKLPDAIPVEADLIGAGKSIKEKPVCPAGGDYAPNAVSESATCSIHGPIAARGSAQSTQ